jgi:hypothetical protein
MSTVTRRLKQRFRISQVSRQMKERLISGKILLSLTCSTVHTSRRLGYIVPAIGGLNPGNSGLEEMSCAVWIATSVHYFWRPLLHQPQSSPTPDLKTPVSRSESTIGTMVITIMETTTKTRLQALPGSTVQELSLVHLGSCPG